MLKAVSWFINGFEKYINFYVYMHFIPTQPQTGVTMFTCTSSQLNPKQVSLCLHALHPNSTQTGVTMFTCSNRDKKNYNGIKAELCQRSIV